MPKHTPKDQLEAIVAIVAAHPSGVRAATIHEGLEFTLPPRMLQRRLALLVEQNRLIAEGRGRGRRYRIPGVAGEVRVTEEGNDTAVAVGEVYPPISPNGAEIKRAVRASIQNRRPVGYNRAFLDAYRPNETFYLPAQVRQHLSY